MAPPTNELVANATTEVRLGDIVREKVSGAIGIVFGKTTELNRVEHVIVEQAGSLRKGCPNRHLCSTPTA